MNFKPFLTFLAEEDGRVRQIVNKVVTSLNKKTPLPHTFIGWREILIMWERNQSRWGQVRNFSFPLGFVFEGGTISRNDYYKFNIDRKLFLIIKRLVCEVDDDYYRIYYKHLYKGELDFSTFEDSPGEGKVTMNIMEGGLSKIIKAGENIQLTIPLDEDAIDINMNGIRLDGSYNWIIPEDQSLGTFYLGMYQLPSEKAAPGVAVFDVTQQATTFPNADNASSLSYFATTTEDVQNARFEGTFKYIQEGPDGGPLPDPNVVFTAALQIYNVDSGTARLEIDLAPNDPYQSTQDITFDETVNLLKGDRLFIKKIGRFRESSIKMTLSSTKSATTIKVFKPFDLYKKICLKLGIPENKIVTNILQQSTFCITCGDAIRGIEGAAIKTSVNDFCKAFDVYLFAGVQIKETVEFEGRDTYFVPDSTDPAIEIGNVKELKITPAVDLMYSSIKVGHAEQNIQDLNGKFDFNGYHIYKTPIQRVSRELDLQSPYKAGPYEIEITRINMEGKTTTDNNNDNDVFVIDVDIVPTTNVNAVLSFVSSINAIFTNIGINYRAGQTITVTGSAANDGTYTITNVQTIPFINLQIIGVAEPVIDEANVAVQVSFLSGFVYDLYRGEIPDSGVPDPDTIFNVRLRPSELLRKHYRWIRSWLHGYDAESLIFETANRNSELEVNGEIDGRDVPIASMGDRIFIPDYFEFTCQPDISLQQVLDETPNKCFAFNWDEVRYTMFLMKAGLNPGDRKEQVFKGLSSIENNRLNLIV